VVGYPSSVNNVLETISTAFTTVVATAKNIGTWLRAIEVRRRYILRTANLDFMATLRNGLFNLSVALDGFHCVYIHLVDDWLPRR
jgi:hypothetical protein